MSLPKQSLYDWLRKNEKHLNQTATSTFLNGNKGLLRIKYPDGFTWELRESDFPMRNGEYGRDAIPREGIKPSFVEQGVEA